MLGVDRKSGERLMGPGPPTWSGLSIIWLTVLMAVALSYPIAINGFPLIFPDTGAYFDIAYRTSFGIERASGYGFFLKPLVALSSGMAGLWLAIALQLLLISLIAVSAVKHLVGWQWAVVALLGTVLMSSWPWHASQFMPDAFTGPLVLLAWLIARDDMSASARVASAFVAVLLTTMHYTHVAIFGVTVMVTLLVHWRGNPGHKRFSTIIFPLFILGLAVASQVIGNKRYLGRASVAPAGPLFQYARLNEDGLIAPWLAKNCHDNRLAELCALAPQLPKDSQELLWSTSSPIDKLIWVRGAADYNRWPLIEQMAIANRGAILDQPGKFVASALRGTMAQFATFGAIDDECPRNCRVPSGYISRALVVLNPEANRLYAHSREANDGLPVAFVRSITTPIAALCIVALPLVFFFSWRRGDQILASLTAAVAAALVANAALAGTLSDVHDRYQSRVVWLAVLVVLVAIARWKSQVTAARSENLGS